MNILAIGFLVFMIIKIMQGYKKGMVKEIISFVSLIIMCIVIGLIGIGLRRYTEGAILEVIVTVLLLAILGIAHHFLSLIFFSIKMLAKLPIISWVDKVLGMVVGALESVLILWTIYAFIMLFGMGLVGQQILQYTQDSSILLKLYEKNYLASWVRSLSGKIFFTQF